MKKLIAFILTFILTVSALPISAFAKVENPIESIIVDDIEVIENTHGYYSEEYDCYIYSSSPTSFTAILKDGSQIESVDGGVEIDGEWYGVSSWDSNYWSQIENPWTVGNTYQMSASVGGFSDTFNVTITESPVVSIEVEDVTCMEGVRGSYIIDDNGGYYLYDDIYFRLNYKVFLSDGSVLDAEEPYIEFGGGGDHGVYINGDFCCISNVIDNQDEQHWGVGTHTATAEFMGVTDEFNVTIIESPVESIEVEDLTIFNGLDSFYNGSYDYYDIYPTYTITFKDGTTKTVREGKGVMLYDDFFSYLNPLFNQYDSPLEVGNTYELTGNFGVKTDVFNVTVKENPVSSIEILKLPEKNEYIVGEFYNLKGMTLRINYIDNTYEDITLEHDYISDYISDYSWYSEKLKRTFSIDSDYQYNAFDKACDEKIEITLLGKTCELNVTVKDNRTESVIIKEAEDKSLVISVNTSDGASYDMKVLDLIYHSKYEDEEWVDYVTIITDKGVFEAERYDDSDKLTIGLGDIYSGNAVISNTLESCEWLDVVNVIHLFLLDKAPILNQNITEYFNGEITEGNIDAIIELAIHSEYFIYDYSSKSFDVIYFTGEELRKQVIKYFALDDIDLTLSKNYDETTDTYTYIIDDMSVGYQLVKPYELTYANGVWTAKLTLSTEEIGKEPTVIYLKLNDEHKVLGFMNSASHNADEHVYSDNYDITCNICGESREIITDGWALINSNWVYFINGEKVVGWQFINNNWYYFNNEGVMQTGWQFINYNWYYFANGGNMLTGWQYIGNNWYYLHASGNMATGWLLDGNTWYFLADGGNMLTGWQYIDSTWYYFNLSGALT